MIFTIDFDKWIATMLPMFLRRRRVFAFCRALCSPVVWLYEQYFATSESKMSMRQDHIYRLTHNGQVCYLRAALNDAFGLTKGFEVEDADDYAGEWVYAKDPTMPQQLLAVDEHLNPARESGEPPPEHPTPLLADEARLNAPHNSFIVRVPHDIYISQLDKVKAIVEKYRILSKQPIYTSTTSTNGQSTILIYSGWKWWQRPLPLIDARLEFYSKPN